MDSDLGSSGVSVTVEYDHHVNYAVQQNSVRVIKQVAITNEGEEALESLVLKLSVEPEFARPRTRVVSRIEPQSTYHVDNCDIELSARFLSELTEMQRGQLRVKLDTEEHDQPLHDETFPVELHAYDEWCGFQSVPDILASFVLPNHPAVERVLASASQQLKTWEMNHGLSGYQSLDPRVAFTCAAAIYTALAKRGFHYVNPPASFEAGQKIRTPDRIEENKLGTCLDLTVLAAACLEQAGLHPLVVFTQGHAFGGVWLRNDSFPEVLIDDVQALRKRIALDEIIVFETTLLTNSPPGDFSDAREAGKRHLEKPEEFEFVLDIARARKRRILPLPTRARRPEAADESEETTHETAVAKLDQAPFVPELQVSDDDGRSEEDDVSGLTRLDRWKQRLLDLTLRNRLLNFRPTKKTVPILCPSLARFEDLLAGGKEFKIRHKPDAFDPTVDVRDRAIHQERHGEDPREAFLLEELESRILRADLTSAELDKRLLQVYREARSNLEEGGANTLYIALGFLQWTDSKPGKRTPRAPLLLIPVELRRLSVRSGFRLAVADEEPLINVTLLRKLETDFELVIPGLDPLPEDESGVDVDAVLRVFREHVKEIEGWEVLDEAWIGIFSFTKYLMWKDLQDKTDLLTQSSVVDHLVNTPTEVFDADFEPLPLRRLDADYHPSATYCVLNADSSQLAAVFQAAHGRTFVLEGPPGTGKSQTITNMISQCLALGQRVLFVSEKKAALEVVARRLRGVGLDPYCLELHSNKISKSEVLAQLRMSLERSEARTPDEWERRANDLAELRGQLNLYVEELHRTQESGRSVFDALSTLIDLEDAPHVELDWPAPLDMPPEQLEACSDVVEKLETAGVDAGNPADHPFRSLELADWSPTLSEEVARLIDDLEQKLATLKEDAHAWAERTGFGSRVASFDELDLLRELGESLLAAPGVPGHLVSVSDWDEVDEKVQKWISLGRVRDEYRAKLYSSYEPSILDLDLFELQSTWERAVSSWKVVGWWRGRPVRKALRATRLNRRKVKEEDVATEIADAIELRDIEKALFAVAEEARQFLGRLWSDGEADWGKIGSASEWAARLRRLAVRAGGSDVESVIRLRQKWAALTDSGSEMLAPGGPIHAEITRFQEALTAFLTSRSNLEARLAAAGAEAWGGRTEAGFLSRTERQVARWRESLPRLRAWCNWRHARLEALRHNLHALIDGYETEGFGEFDLPTVFRKSYARASVNAAYAKSETLSRFSSSEHDRLIQNFRRADEQFLEYTQACVAAKVAAEIPRTSTNVSKNSELGILQREIQKKRGHKPVRKLLEETPQLTPRLKPCFLMSPLSVAQYLPAGDQVFDLVIFDEASQIPVWDAVGALARGKNAVIVGDPKQLPPTSFFDLSKDDESAGGEIIEDLESILDDCMGAGVPLLKLDWHYRSRHEGLITFSNYHYYDNRLLTFPAPVTDATGVQLRHVADGIYDKGKSRTNRKEAERVVAEIVQRLRSPSDVSKSIGVVTFSQAQQSLIEDLLEPARSEHPEIEEYFSTDLPEPVFVKNLENVQGDERDVILFSICYAKDIHGRMSMNFGPINKKGGERRLNVAITRARKEVLVFASVRAHDIDLNRTSARGVQDLKNFLDYADRGPKAIAEATSSSVLSDVESPFEAQVRDELVSRGWQVHAQVGCSGYRIDLGIVDPDRPGRYLLGVECDGAAYHSGKTARDRDRIRQGVLEELGWTLHRIWSTEWWQDRRGQMEKLDAVLVETKKAADDESVEASLEDGGTEESECAREASNTTDLKTESLGTDALDHEFGSLEVSTVDVISEPAPTTSKRYARGQAPSTGRDRPYEVTTLPVALGRQDEFYEEGAAHEIRSMITQVIETEGPVSSDVVTQRVATAWGFGRRGRIIRERIESLLPKEGWTDFNGKQFYWPSEFGPETYREYRTAKSSPRSIEDIAVEEIGNAFLQVLEVQISLPVEDLCREVAREFGYGRTTTQLKAGLGRALHRLSDAGRVLVDGDRVSLGSS